MIGQTISHYKILEKLGEGGMGVVFKARDITLDRDVALKFLPQDLTRDSDAKERFIHEAKAASALDHNNICAIYEIGQTEDGRSFMAMACYEGENLKKKIEAGPLKIDSVIEISIQVAQGLSKAHEKGIVHRDIKPANILITTDGVVKILDFGLAKLRGLSKLTKTGSTLGTAPYMSPEQAKGEEVDSRTDIWSLGVLMFEMITGQLPFKGDYEQAITYQIINAAPEPITGIRTGVPIELERIVNKCIEKSPEERYQTTADLIADLKHVQRTIGQSTLHTMIQKGAKFPNKRLLVFIITLLVVVISLVIIFKPFNKRTEKNIKSIAVLPFRNISGNEEVNYFSEGIAEDIRTQLCKINALTVLSQQAVLKYKNSNSAIRDIANDLDVDAVLEGSVQREGKSAHVNAQLIDGKTEGHIWGETYDEEGSQIIVLQSKIALRIAEALKIKFTPAEKERIETKPTDNLDAYDYYLKGMSYYIRQTKKDNEDAIGLFKKALGLDPNYARAYAGLGDAYTFRPSWGFPPAWRDSALAMSRKALSIDQNLAEGHKALGLAYTSRGWLRKGIIEYQKAVEVNPNFFPAINNMGVNYSALGKFDEALKCYKKSIILQPTSPHPYEIMGSNYTIMGDYAKALELYKKALAVHPDHIDALGHLWSIYLRREEYQQAIDMARKILDLYPDHTSAVLYAGTTELFQGHYKDAERYFEKQLAVDTAYDNALLGYVYWKTGRKDEAQRMFARSIRNDEEGLANGDEGYGRPRELAQISAVQGNRAEAYKWLQKTIDAGWRDYLYAQIDPLLENLRNEDRFKQMMIDVRMMVEEMRKHCEEIEINQVVNK